VCIYVRVDVWTCVCACVRVCVRARVRVCIGALLVPVEVWVVSLCAATNYHPEREVALTYTPCFHQRGVLESLTDKPSKKTASLCGTVGQW
jgi:hypothetical protein